MRTIKYRAWDKDDNRMLNCIPWVATSYCCTDPIHELEYMQFTGLHDKKGKEVFEGDILDWRDGAYAVRYDAGLGGYSLGASYGWPFRGVVDCEIIGNIYEHSHLLYNK